jgi:arylsulfatase A-like enzyme
MKLGNAPRPPNLLILLTDQQRWFRHWPAGWVEENLPSFARLASKGLTFERAFTNTCQCSPSRATLWTSLFPAQTQVLYTMGGPALPTNSLTLGDVLTRAGYQVGYCGKWHLLGTDEEGVPSRHGFATWDPPDAGNSLTDYTTLGAGVGRNDARFLGAAPGARGAQGSGPSMIEFLKSVDPSRPFCLIASFVNPHDICIAPFGYEEAGYDPAQWEALPIPVPETWDENLSTKPSVQRWYQQLSDSSRVPSWSEAERKGYVQFYAYLQRLVDKDIMTLLDTLEAQGLTDSTVIFRLADHGEQALSHGLVEKSFNAYDETINVPLIISNPRLFPSPVVTRELAGHIDLLPTVASVAGVLDQYAGRFKGIDLSPLFTAPDQPLQEAIHFTFDDIPPEMEVPSGTPCYIRALRTKGWLYAAYYTADGATFEYELYDLDADPDEKLNLASPTRLEGLERKEREELAQRLREMNTRLVRAMEAYGTTPSGFTWPEPPDV